MANNLPTFLVSNIRSAFHQCAQQRRCNVYRQFHSSRFLQVKPSVVNSVPRARNDSIPDRKREKSVVQQSHAGSKTVESESSSTQSLDADPSRSLVPQEQGERAVRTGRTVDAPMKIIPKADITPNLKLTPRERLHIEILTRRAPPVVKQIKPYKERLLIYHHGYAAENALIFLKVFGLVCAGVVSLIVVPAHYSAGTSPWLCGLFFLGGWVPACFFHHLLKPLVTRVHLRLPPKSRVSPDAAMNYAKNLPSSAQVDISFTRITALPGTIVANLADLQPISAASRWPWQSANIKWIGNNVDRGSRLRPNPTEFSVKSTIAGGRARRDVIPGIWPEVYKRLTGVTREHISRWRRG